MAECSLELIENQVFTPKQTRKVRELINQLPEGYRKERVEEIRKRLNDIESEVENDG